jgi:hypothetical protein
MWMRKLLAALAVAALTGIGVVAVAIAGDTGPSSANAESVTYVAGNPTCPAGTVGSFKVEPVANGTYNDLVTISNFDGKTLDWALTPDALHLYDVAYVIVKGGPNANLYTYDFASGGLDDSDSGLHPPVNPNGKGPKYYGFSHVDFCFDPKG